MRYNIGIDPDVDRSGVCVIDRTGMNAMILENFRFFELYKFLDDNRKSLNKVYIEAGWLNKSNWHTSKKNSTAVNAQIGNHTGANHETGRKIVEMCEYIGVPFELIRPTRSKLNAELFNKYTGHAGITNQEQRDACMLVFGRK